MEHIKKVALSVLAAMAAVCMATALLLWSMPMLRVVAAETTVSTAEELQRQIDSANVGDTVKLGAAISADITVPQEKEITLDLNGFTLTNESDHTIMNYGTLTIVDSSAEGTGTVDNVTHARGALFNFGEATLLGGTYTRSHENGSSATESGGNSWYVIKNLGHLTIGEKDTECDVAVTQSGHFSSMITNGYYNADDSGDHSQYYASVTTEDKIPTLVINGGTFSGGINTVKNDNHSVAVINGGEFTNVSQAVVLNWHDLTITGGEFEAGEGAQAAIITSYDNTGFNDGKTTITGGTFEGAVTADYNPGDVTYSVSGGTFSEELPADYIAADAVLYQQENGSYAVADEDTAVADGIKVVMDGVGYKALEEAVAAAPTDNTQVTITFVDGDGDKVIAGNGVVVKAGQNIVFDYNGNTYDIDGTTVGSSGTETNGFQLLKGSTVVMQNGTLTSDKAIILIQKYCDLTLDDMILDGTQTNNYVLSNNNDTTTITGDTQIIAAGSGVAFDVCYWDAYDEVSVVFDEAFTGSVQGVIEYGVYSYTGSAEEWIENTSIAIKGEGSFDVTIRMMKYDDADPADANISVSSGTFVKPIAEEYIAEDSLLIPAGDGTYTVEDYESAVGTVTGLIVGNAVYADIAAAEEAGVHVVATIAASESLTYGYTTLIDALRAATAENMVVLADNVTTGGITAGKSFNIDLNEHSIEFTGMFLLNGTDVEGGITVNISNGTIKGTNYGIVAFNNVTLGLTDVNASGSLEGIFVPTSVGETKADKPTAITIEGGIFKGTGENGAGAVICGVGDGVEAPTKLVATGAVFEGTTYGISGNGTAHNTYIELSDCTVNGEVGIYNPQDGELIVNGGSVYGGSTGIEIRSGSLTVNGGAEITGAGDPFASDPNGNGTTTTGAAVAVSQHTTNLPIKVTVNDAVLNGVRALFEADLQDEIATDQITITVLGGTFNGEVVSENVTGFIHGGQYKVLPAEELFAEGYTGELYNGYYIVVGEGTAAEDVGALLTARLEAQTDVRLYAAALGFRWADVQDDAEIASAYAAINAATSTSAVALAKAQAMDAIDAYCAAYEKELAAAREAALEKIEAAAGDDIAVPTSVYAAINGGASVEEIEAYAEAAVKEIEAIRSLRSEITAQAGELEGIAAAVEKLEGAFAGQGGEFDSLLGDIRAAISAAQEAIESGTSEALQDMQAALEAKIDAGTQAVKDAVSGVMEELTQLAESVAAGDKALQEAIAAGEKVLAEQIEAVQGDIDALEGAVDGQGSDLQASIDALESAVGEQASAVQADIDALSAAIAAAQADIDDILASIAAGGPSFEELAEQIAAIKSTADGLQTSVGDVQTAVKAAQDAVAAAQGALSGQIEEADDAAAFTTLYVLVGIALALSAAAVALLVVLLLKRSKAA